MKCKRWSVKRYHNGLLVYFKEVYLCLCSICEPNVILKFRSVYVRLNKRMFTHLFGSLQHQTGSNPSRNVSFLLKNGRVLVNFWQPFENLDVSQSFSGPKYFLPPLNDALLLLHVARLDKTY